MRTNVLGASGPRLLQVHWAKNEVLSGGIKVEKSANHVRGIETGLFHLAEVVHAKKG